MNIPTRQPTCVIAEDETLFLAALKRQLFEAWPELRIVAEAADGGAALNAIEQYQPTIAFLDIRMPGLTGLQVAGALVEVSPETQVVFVTAYDQYALKAFDAGAVDYVLKPIDESRFADALTRVKKRLSSSAPDAVLLATVAHQLSGALAKQALEPPLQWITASAGKETRLIGIDDVLYIRSDAGYTAVVTEHGEALLRTPIKELVARLDPSFFKQIHRSTIVNLRAVAGVVRDESGRGTLRLKGRDETLAVSLTFMPLFRNM